MLLRLSLILTLVAGPWGQPAQAQSVLPDRGAAALDQATRDLLTDRRVMCFAAHPDDEDLETLVYLRKALGVRTRTVFATRGEGGQNEIGDELYRDLGVLRTAECEAAAAVSGSSLAFLNMYDFGFSKSAEETFEKWGRERLERSVVREIRRWRPHVVITNHDEVSGHGHHQALGRALMTVWDRLGAADAYPELTQEGFLPWQPEALFLHVFDDEGEADVEIPVGDHDWLRGMTYSQLALGALQLHRSQGRWERDLPLAPRATRYRRMKVSRSGFGEGLLGGREPPWFPPDSVYDYVHEDILRTRTTTDRGIIATYLARARALADLQFSEATPQEVRDLLVLDRAVVEAVGLKLEATCLDPIVTPDQLLRVRVRYHLVGAVPLRSPRLSLACGAGTAYRFEEAPLPVDAEGMLTRGASGEIVMVGEPLSVAPTLPRVEHLYESVELAPRAELVASFEIAHFQTKISSRVPVRFDVALPVELVPPGMPTVALPGTSGSVSVAIIAHATGPATGYVTVTGLPGVTESLRLPFAAKGDGGRTAVLVPYQLAAGATAGDHQLAIDVLLDGSGADAPVASARHILRVVDAEVVGDPLVGVVYTYDDTLERALTSLRVRHTRVAPETILAGDLTRFDVICLDLRAYLERPDVVAANQRLMDHVRAGGYVVVFYNKLFEWNPGAPPHPGQGFGPYPLELTHARITDENAPVEILEPEHPLLSFPRQMTRADFAGWIQERGLYYPTDVDPRYQQLLSSHDPGEAALTGGLLHTRLGSGDYVYTSMVWYRQWRVGQPGSYRFLANLLSLPAFRR